jgi:hypothetical protein
MFNKIPQRSLPSSHTISLKESLKERTKVLPLQRREKEIHLKLAARGMVTTMSSVGNCIRRKDESSSVERGRQRPLLQYNKILVLIQKMRKRSPQLEYKVQVPFMLVQVPLMNFMMMKERRMNYFT